MPSLEEVLTRLQESGRIAHVTLVPSKNEWQASFRETGGSGYKIEIRKTAVEALLAALGPKWNQSWDEHLSTPQPRAAPRTKDVRKRAKRKAEAEFDDDIEDLL